MLNPEDSDAWYYRAFALSVPERAMDALFAYERAIRLEGFYKISQNTDEFLRLPLHRRVNPILNNHDL